MCSMSEGVVHVRVSHQSRRGLYQSWIALVKPIHVHLFNFLVIFVSDQAHNQDKLLYLNLFEETSFLLNAH